MEPISATAALAAYYTARELFGVAQEIQGSAKKFLDKRSKNKPIDEKESSIDASAGPLVPDANANSTPESRINGMHDAISELGNELRESAYIIKTLAAHNQLLSENLGVTAGQVKSLVDANEQLTIDMATIKAKNQLLAEGLKSTGEKVESLTDVNDQLTKDMAATKLKLKWLVVVCIAVAVAAMSGLAVAVNLAMK